MEAADLDRMRDCFAAAAVWQNWSAEDKAEFAADIRAAIDTNDEATLAWWAAYLEQASGLAYLEAACRRIEADIKARRSA